MITIPPNIYDYKLNEFLWESLIKAGDDKNIIEEITLLKELISCSLTGILKNKREIKNVKLSNKERDIIIKNKWNESDNIEVRTRCKDVLIRSINDDRLYYILSLVKEYSKAYEEEDNVECV